MFISWVRYLLEHHDLLVADAAVVELGGPFCVDGHLLGECRADQGGDGTDCRGRLHLDAVVDLLFVQSRGYRVMAKANASQHRFIQRNAYKERSRLCKG
jgi:hypothetical protein